MPTAVRFTPRCHALEPRAVPANFDSPVFAVGADAGGGPRVRVFDQATRQPVADFFAFEPTFTGGVRVAVGDVTADGVTDLIAAAGPGGGPRVVAFRGLGDGAGGVAGFDTARPVLSFFAYDPSFRGGVHVAVDNLDTSNDGPAGQRKEVVTGAGEGGGPHVQVFRIDPATGTPRPSASFMAFDPAARGGVTVATADPTAGPTASAVYAGAGPGGPPRVRVFRAVAPGGVFAGIDPVPAAEVLAFDASLRGGVFVAGDDIDGDTFDDLIVGAGRGGGPHVKVFRSLADPDRPAFDLDAPFASVFVGPAAERAGARVSSLPGGTVLALPGRGVPTELRAVNVRGGTAGARPAFPPLSPFGPDFRGGGFGSL